MPGFPLNSSRNFVQVGILLVNVSTVKEYCLSYTFVDGFSAAESAAGERPINRINIGIECAGLPLLIFMECPPCCGRGLSDSHVRATRPRPSRVRRIR